MRDALAPGFVAGGVSAEAVSEAERHLSVVFPRSYRLFLLNFGAGAAGGFELSGLLGTEPDPEEPPMWSDVVKRTKQLRRVSGGKLPASLIPFSDDGGDYTFFLDTAERDSSDESPIRVLGPGRNCDKVADDFLCFLALAAQDRVLRNGAG